MVAFHLFYVLGIVQRKILKWNRFTGSKSLIRGYGRRLSGLQRGKIFPFENRALRRIFGPNRDVVRGECRKLHNEELNDLYCSPNTVRVIKSIRMRWAGHVARMVERTDVCRFLVGNLRKRDH